MIKINDKGINLVKIFLIISLFLVSIPDFTIGKNGTTVSIEDCSLSSGETIIIPIYISRVVDLASAEVNLSFDTSVISILSVLDGNFDLTLSEIDNESGWARIGGAQLMSGWLNGKIILANLSLKAIGEPGTTSPLNFTNVLLQDKTGSILSTIVINGTCRIKDTAPPVITNVTVYPEAQKSGGHVNITCGVEDNVAVDEVWINVTYPDTSYHNFSMIKNSYYLNQTYDMIGNYFYVIWATDTSGNTNKSSKDMFSITPHYYALSISASPQQGGTVTHTPPREKYEEETQVTLTAIPATGYQFSHWEEDATGINSSIHITMDADKNITAYFQETIIHYTLSSFITPSGGGSITLNPFGGIYNEGTTVTATATANPGYEFDHWSGDISGNNLSVQLTMDQGKNITAHFKEIIEQYTLNISCIPAGGGSISFSPPNSLYDKGTIVTITAFPHVGYIFDYWLGDATGTSSTTTITMTKDKHVAAHFIAPTINQLPVCSISADPTSGPVPLMAAFTLTASDSDGSISSWGLDIDNDGTPEYSGSGNPPITQQHTYTSQGTYTIKFTVTDNQSAISSDTTVITATKVSPENKPPVAHFTYSYDGRIVKFIDSSTDSDGNITTWHWDFGDQHYSVASSPTHEYQEGGDYTVELTVTDDDGESNSFTQVITVESGEEDNGDEDGGGIPGFEFTLLILSILGLLFSTQRKRKHGYK